VSYDFTSIRLSKGFSPSSCQNMLGTPIKRRPHRCDRRRLTWRSIFNSRVARQAVGRIAQPALRSGLASLSEWPSSRLIPCTGLALVFGTDVIQNPQKAPRTITTASSSLYNADGPRQ
jgi:hypothetical protein